MGKTNRQQNKTNNGHPIINNWGDNLKTTMSIDSRGVLKIAVAQVDQFESVMFKTVVSFKKGRGFISIVEKEQE